MTKLTFSKMTVEEFENLCSTSKSAVLSGTCIMYDDVSMFWNEYHPEQSLLGGKI